jgi:hypothetical protein
MAIPMGHDEKASDLVFFPGQQLGEEKQQKPAEFDPWPMAS